MTRNFHRTNHQPANGAVLLGALTCLQAAGCVSAVSDPAESVDEKQIIIPAEPPPESVTSLVTCHRSFSAGSGFRQSYSLTLTFSGHDGSLCLMQGRVRGQRTRPAPHEALRQDLIFGGPCFNEGGAISLINGTWRVRIEGMQTGNAWSGTGRLLKAGVMATSPKTTGDPFSLSHAVGNVRFDAEPIFINQLGWSERLPANFEECAISSCDGSPDCGGDSSNEVPTTSI